MTKKVTLDKTEYDEMEKEIERLKSINEELVKGASVVIEPEININPRFPSFDWMSSRGFKDIMTTKKSVPDHKKLQDLWADLQDKIQNNLYEHIQEKLADLERQEDSMKIKKDEFNEELENKRVEFEENLKKKEQDFKNTRRVSLENQENERKRLKEEYDKKVALFEKQKQWYKDRPIKRYVLSGALLALAGNYMLRLI